jgi:hypothetical protein
LWRGSTPSSESFGGPVLRKTTLPLLLLLDLGRTYASQRKMGALASGIYILLTKVSLPMLLMILLITKILFLQLSIKPNTFTIILSGLLTLLDLGSFFGLPFCRLKGTSATTLHTKFMQVTHPFRQLLGVQCGIPSTTIYCFL